MFWCSGLRGLCGRTLFFLWRRFQTNPVYSEKDCFEFSKHRKTECKQSADSNYISKNIVFTKILIFVLQKWYVYYVFSKQIAVFRFFLIVNKSIFEKKQNAKAKWAYWQENELWLSWWNPKLKIQAKPIFYNEAYQLNLLSNYNQIVDTNLNQTYKKCYSFFYMYYENDFKLLIDGLSEIFV